MDERAEKAKRRFENMLADARTAVAEASAGIPSGNVSPRALLVATKALNRAGGFLEAVSIALPELGLELIEEFEAFAAEVDQLSGSIPPETAAPQEQEQRAGGERRLTNDRRGWDRRLARDRRHQHVQVLTERRASGERRTQVDRRTGHARQMADRRFRSLAP